MVNRARGLPHKDSFSMEMSNGKLYLAYHPKVKLQPECFILWAQNYTFLAVSIHKWSI
jgi:hypothetical protein